MARFCCRAIYKMDQDHKPDEARRSKSIKLALFFGAIAVLWYVVSMIVVWTQ